MTLTLTQFPNFQIFASSDLEWIQSIATLEDYQPDQILIREGQLNHSIYFLLSGTLGVTVSRQEGGELQLKTLTSGEVMGEMSFLDHHLPSATIRAIDLCQVLSIHKSLLTRKLEQDKSFAARFYQFLAIKLSKQLRELSQVLTSNQAMPGEPLRKVLLVFAILNDRDLDWLATHGTVQKVVPQTTLIEQGKVVPAIYILLEGTLGVYLTAVTDGLAAEKEIAKSVKGEILGEVSFVEAGTASATVRALESSWLLAIPIPKLTEKLEQDQGFAVRFYQSIAIVLSNRWRDRLVRRGFATLAHTQAQLLSEDIEAEDELEADVLDGTAIAGTRFDWMIRRLRA